MFLNSSCNPSLPYLGLAYLQYAHRVVLAAAAGDMGQGKAAGRILLLSSQFGQSPKPPTFLVSYKGYVNLALQLCALGREEWGGKDVKLSDSRNL